MTTPELFPYQQVGAEWLAGRRLAYLADEQGLGKSAQAITAADLAGARKVCVVCPASVRDNWVREIERFSFGLWDAEVLSYDRAVRGGLPEADTYVIDEAHYAKSAAAQRTKVLLGPGSRLRQGERIWALSGTPAPNHLGEMWTWLRFFGATPLNYRQFLDAHCNYKMGDFGPKVFGNKRGAVERIQADMAQVLLRRKKSEVALDLPAVRWGDIFLAQNDGQCRELLVDKDLLIDERLPTEDEHLARLKKQTGEAKAPALARFLAEELSEGDDKIVVFAWHKSVLDLLEQGLGKFGVVRIDGETPTAKRQGLVDAFQTGHPRVFLGNIVAAGTGITLTAAASLVFAEMSWVPGENAQAAMRVHRIGQTQPVLIRTTTLRGSLDEAVNAVLARKTRALNELYGEDQ